MNRFHKKPLRWQTGSSHVLNSGLNFQEATEPTEQNRAIYMTDKFI